MENGKYLQQVIAVGTNDRGYQPVVLLYKVIINHIAVFNELMNEEYGGEEHIMKLLGTGVLSESV